MIVRVRSRVYVALPKVDYPAAPSIKLAWFVVTASDLRKLFSFGPAFYFFWTGLGLAIVGERFLLNSFLARGRADATGVASPYVPIPAQYVAAMNVVAPNVSGNLQAQPRMSPACPQCGAPMSWVAQHERNYCSHCSAYL